MASVTVATPSADARLGRYRQAEQELWGHYGLDPTERFVDLDSPSVRLRVLEVGSGEPVLFVHGTAGPGSWPPLVAELPDFRCLVLERPGWGLSSAVDFSRHDYGSVTAEILCGALDALGLDRAHVVGGSIGNVWALRLAQRHPTRVGRVALMGGSPLVPEIEIPKIIKLLASPLGALMVRLPDKPARVRAILAQSGHREALADGRIPDEFVGWRVALSRETDSMRHERDMVRALVHGKGWRSGLTFGPAELASIRQPTLLVYGSADHVGTAEIWRRALGLLPRGEFRLVEGAGHQPWFDDPSGIATEVGRFLAG